MFGFSCDTLIEAEQSRCLGMGRRRARLVPQGAVECFEVRIVLYFETDGEAYVSVNVSDPDGRSDAPMYEILGVLEQAKYALLGERLEEEGG